MNTPVETLAVVGARLNSSRLPAKHFLDLAGKPMIARLIDRLRTVKDIDQIILATTADDFNKPLVDWAKAYGVECLAFEGDVNDLMGRMDAAVQANDPQRILYVCGDCPLIDPATLASSIAALKTNDQADTAHLPTPPEGRSWIHEGHDIYSRAFWDQMVRAAREPFEREHVGAVYHSSKKVVPQQIAPIKSNPVFMALNHRISVDTLSDARFMQQVYRDWYRNNPADSIVSLEHVVLRLLSEPDLAALNAHVHQKAVGEIPPKTLIICDAGKQTGLGHLARAKASAQFLQDHLASSVKILIRSDADEFSLANGLHHRIIAPGQLLAALDKNEFDILILDVIENDTEVRSICETVVKAPKLAPIIAIDGPFHLANISLHLVPSLFAATTLQAQLSESLIFGIDCMLVPASIERRLPIKAIKNLLVITGGSDTVGLGNTLPKLLEQRLDAKVNITWVQGPQADAPHLPDQSSRQWHVLNAPADLALRMHEYDAALCTYGVSMFECLRAGLPTVTFDALGTIEMDEWTAVSSSGMLMAGQNMDDAIALMAALVDDIDLTNKLAKNARYVMQASNGALLAHAVRVLTRRDQQTPEDSNDL